jgi:hypothetical protein
MVMLIFFYNQTLGFFQTLGLVRFLGSLCTIFGLVVHRVNKEVNTWDIGLFRCFVPDYFLSKEGSNRSEIENFFLPNILKLKV